jgi:hypothetical protein
MTTLQVAEMRTRYAAGESPAAIARSFGVASSTVQRWVGTRKGVFGPRPVPPHHCDVCLVLATKPKANVRRFALQEATRGVNRGRGAIELCEQCWSEICAPRQRKPRVVERRAA